LGGGEGRRCFGRLIKKLILLCRFTNFVADTLNKKFSAMPKREHTDMKKLSLRMAVFLNVALCSMVGCNITIVSHFILVTMRT
jgi:hypothetical protein